MSQREPVDVIFEEISRKRAWRPKLTAGDIEQLSNTIIGLALLGVACYGVHLFLANNF